MSDMRYNKDFKSGIATLLFCILLFGTIIAFFVAHSIQYKRLTADMLSVEAMIVDIGFDVHVKGPNEQEIYVEYVVDGVKYSRELKSDTKISFAAGTGAHYSIGDMIEILYDPQDPETIATPRTLFVGGFFTVVSLFGLTLVLFVLVVVLKNHKKYKVTCEEYEKEKELLRKSKQKEKNRKIQLRLERRNRHPRLSMMLKICLIVISSLVGAFILYIILGLILIALRG